MGFESGEDRVVVSVFGHGGGSQKSDFARGRGEKSNFIYAFLNNMKCLWNYSLAFAHPCCSLTTRCLTKCVQIARVVTLRNVT
jgi:hypothetical protein